MSATQSRLGAAARNARSTRSSHTRTPGTRIVVLPRRLATMPVMPAWRISRATRFRPIRSPSASTSSAWMRGSIDLAVGLVDLPDPRQQPLVVELAGRRRAALPGVKARARHPEHAAHRLDRVLGLLRRDGPEDHRRVSL